MKKQIVPLLLAMGMAGWGSQAASAQVREVNLTAGDSAADYAAVLDAIDQHSPWEADAEFSLVIQNSRPDKAAYEVKFLSSPDDFYSDGFTGRDRDDHSVALRLQRIAVQAENTGLLFLEDGATFRTNCSTVIEAATAVKENDGVSGLLSFDGVGALDRPTVSVIGDVDFANGYVQFSAVDATLEGQGTIKEMDLFDDAAVVIQNNSDLPRRTFFQIETLDASSGRLNICGNGHQAIVQAKELTVSGGRTGGTVHVLNQGTLVWGDVCPEATTLFDSQRAIVTALGNVIEARGSDRPTLLSNRSRLSVNGNAESFSALIGEAGTVTTNFPSVVLGSDARWILLFNETVASAPSGEAVSVTALPGAELVIYGWDGTNTDLGIDWDPAYVSFAGTLLGRAQVRRGDSTLMIERRWMKDTPGLKAVHCVEEAERGLYAATATAPGIELLRAAISDANVGDQAFADFVDSSVFLPFSSGTIILAERAFDAVHENMLDRAIERTANDTHWWVSASTEKRRVPNALLRGDSSTVSLGADAVLNESWVVSGALSGTKTNSSTRHLSGGVNGDASMAAVSAVLENRISETSALRLGVSAGRAEMTAKKIGVEHRIKTEPKMTIGSIGARLSTRCGENGVWTPWVGIDGFYAKATDGEVRDTSLFGGHDGVGFKTQSKKRIWGNVLAGISADTQLSVWDYAVRPSFSLMGKAAFGDKNWKVSSSLAAVDCMADHASFRSTATWSVRAEASVNIASSREVPVMEGGIFGFGEKDTGKTALEDWQLNLKAGYERANGSERAAYVKFEYRENW